MSTIQRVVALWTDQAQFRGLYGMTRRCFMDEYVLAIYGVVMRLSESDFEPIAWLAGMRDEYGKFWVRLLGHRVDDVGAFGYFKSTELTQSHWSFYVEYCFCHIDLGGICTRVSA